MEGAAVLNRIGRELMMLRVPTGVSYDTNVDIDNGHIVGGRKRSPYPKSNATTQRSQLVDPAPTYSSAQDQQNASGRGPWRLPGSNLGTSRRRAESLIVWVPPQRARYLPTSYTEMRVAFVGEIRESPARFQDFAKRLTKHLLIRTLPPGCSS